MKSWPEQSRYVAGDARFGSEPSDLRFRSSSVKVEPPQNLMLLCPVDVDRYLKVESFERSVAENFERSLLSTRQKTGS